MRVLVTGGAGFIGSHVVEMLVGDGHDVLVVDDLSTGSLNNLEPARALGLVDNRVHISSYADPAVLVLLEQFKPEVVCHLAAQMSVQVSMRDPLLDVRLNITALAEFVMNCVATGVTRFVLATSGGTIYGDLSADQRVDELKRGRPASFYGLSKLWGAEYLELVDRHFDLITTSLALGNVYGPRQNPAGEAGVIAIFSAALSAGRECVIYGDGSIERDFIHVTDVARAFREACRKGNGLINIASGNSTSVLTIFEKLRKLHERNAIPKFVPGRSGEVRAVRLDISRAYRTLGWVPRVQLDEGLQDLILQRLATSGATSNPGAEACGY